MTPWKEHNQAPSVAGHRGLVPCVPLAREIEQISFINIVKQLESFVKEMPPPCGTAFVGRF